MSHLTKDSITGYVSDAPEIKSNKEIVPMEAIKKHAGTPHSASLVAITMLDMPYRELHINIKFDNNLYLNSFVEQLLAVWDKYEPIPSFIRSYKKDGTYLVEFDGINMQTENISTPSLTDFKEKKVLIDMISDEDTYEFRLYRWGENSPRLLNLSIKTLE